MPCPPDCPAVCPALEAQALGLKVVAQGLLLWAWLSLGRVLPSRSRLTPASWPDLLQKGWHSEEWFGLLFLILDLLYRLLNL